MRYTDVELRSFRNYHHLKISLNPGTTVLYGPNGSGKTNLLEALHLFSLGRSHRTLSDREMVQSGQDVACVKASTERLDGRHDIEVRLNPKEKPHKRLLLYGKPARRMGELMGHATVVMFSPEDLHIVRDGPQARRRFVDMQLCQIRPGYLNALKTYLEALENRNALLRRQKLEGVKGFSAQMDAWDEQLCQAAVPLVRNRQWFLKELSREAAAQYTLISENPEEPFLLRYHSPFAEDSNPDQTLGRLLEKSREEDVGRMFTWYGPHRDDLSMELCGVDLRAYGSQGQLRTAVLSMKLGEIRLIENEMGESPALLLDDVFSELDLRRRSALLAGTRDLQTVLTCTDKSDAADAHADVFLRVARGNDGNGQILTEE